MSVAARTRLSPDLFMESLSGSWSTLEGEVEGSWGYDSVAWVQGRR
jgi:hypothetical protein